MSSAHAPDPSITDDPDFVRSLTAYADATIALVVAIALTVGLTLAGVGPWIVVVMLLPLPWLVVGARHGHVASQRVKAAHPGRWASIDAERRAVWAAFGPALIRPRRRA
jgi:hypothetical protein